MREGKNPRRRSVGGIFFVPQRLERKIPLADRPDRAHPLPSPRPLLFTCHRAHQSLLSVTIVGRKGRDKQHDESGGVGEVGGLCTAAHGGWEDYSIARI